MGVVYKAHDKIMKREVAIKTLLDIKNPAALELFYKEWSVLSTIVHPNIVGIYDIGEFEQDGEPRPFFVMPLLQGVTLDKLIKENSPRLAESGVEIMVQACRGLQAAHEKGLIHRDLKPSNIFVMEDASVKLIDFGIARLLSRESRSGLKGTVYYMAPEQFQMQPSTALSDVFSLGAVCYEVLAGRRPFQGPNEPAVMHAVLNVNPPLASEINPNVKPAVSQVVQKALAKQPWHRFPSAREFGEALQKALHDESPVYFDNSKIQLRLERAAKALERGDHEFASEILSELESEGHSAPEIALLRRQLDQAMRQAKVGALVEGTRRFFEAEEYDLALRKIQQALDLDPEPDDPVLLDLKHRVETARRDKEIEGWMRLARQHLESRSFRQAREALENVFRLRPSHSVALELSSEVASREQEAIESREEKSRLYQAAVEAWERGEVTAALGKMEALLALERDIPDTDGSGKTKYEELHRQIRAEFDAGKSAYGEARRRLAAGDFQAALALCQQQLAKHPDHALFRSLKFDIEEAQRQQHSAFIAEIDRRVREEADLDRRLQILKEAIQLCPGEKHFETALRLSREKRDLANSILEKSRQLEEQKRFQDALEQWEMLRAVHDKYPGLNLKIELLTKSLDQQTRQQTKTRLIRRIDRYLESGGYGQASAAVRDALAQFPGDTELQELVKVISGRQAQAAEAMELLGQATELQQAGRLQEALGLLRQARKLDRHNSAIRAALANCLLEAARPLLQTDWEAAEGILQEALKLDAHHAAAHSLRRQISDRKREEFVSWCLVQARRLQGAGEIASALAVVDQGIESSRSDGRLLHVRSVLQVAVARANPSAVAREPVAKPDAASLPTESMPSEAPAAGAMAEPGPTRRQDPGSSNEKLRN